jgi:hypothetical protein
MPGKFSVQVEAEEGDVLRAGKLRTVHVHRRARAWTSGEGDVNGFEGVGVHAPGAEPGLDGVKVGLEVEGSCCGVTV